MRLLPFLFSLLTLPAAAQIHPDISADSARLVNIFTTLHQQPELSFKETKTAALVAEELRRLGFTVHTGLGGTGVAALLKNGSGTTVWFRADMDGLPVQETTGLPYASKTTTVNAEGQSVPVMHACGHDAHLTWLLGLAQHMKAHQKEWKGNLVLIAQPAEEVGLGAVAVAGTNWDSLGLPKPQYYLGMHTMPFATGLISNAGGYRMAGVEVFDVHFHGVGGHGSAPHLTKDPVVMAATAIQQYHSMVGRSIAAQHPHVITVGSVQAGTVNNIIPDKAVLKLNLRWFGQDDRRAMIDGIDRVNKGIATAMDLPAALQPTTIFKASLPPLVNDSSLSIRLNRSFARQFGTDANLVSRPASMVSEDFALLVKGIEPPPASNYVFVGVANPQLLAAARARGREYAFYNHNGNFQVDLSAIPFGTQVAVTMVMNLMGKQ